MKKKRSQKKHKTGGGGKDNVHLPHSKVQNKSGEGKKWWIFLAVVGVVTLASYFNCLTNQFVFDDFHLISNNTAIRGIEKIPQLLQRGEEGGAYRPVRMASYSIDFSLSKYLWRYMGSSVGYTVNYNTLVFHVSNVIYHLLTSLLVFLVVYRLGSHYRIAFLAAALFALHPVHTDSVTYLSGRRDILFALFYLAGFYFFLCYRKKRQSGYIIAALIMYLLSLGSKEMGVTLPAIFLCYDLAENFPGRTRSINLVYLKELLRTFKEVVVQSKYLYVPLLIGALSFGYYKAFIKSPSHQIHYYGDSIVVTFLTVGRIIVHYLKLLVFPINLNADYSYNAFPLSVSFFEPGTFFSFIILGVIGYALLRLLNTHKIMAFGGIWFFVTLLPVCHIFPHHELLAEHYLYLPSFGFCLVVAYLLNGFLEERRYRSYIYASFTAIIILFSLRIVERNRDWRDELTLWEKTVQIVPQCARAHNNLGYTYAKKHMFEEAILEYEKTLAIEPINAKAHYNLGSAYHKKGDLDKAISKYNETLTLEPRYAKAHHKLGNAYSQMGKFEKAIARYEQALAIEPNNPQVYYNLGNAYHKKGDFDKAISAYKNAITINPGKADAHYNLGLTYEKKGMLDEAIIEYREAVLIDPRFADVHYNLGSTYGKKGMLDESIIEYKKVLSIEPDHADTHFNLSVAYYYKGNYALALFHCDKAEELGIEINPKFLEVLKSYR